MNDNLENIFKNLENQFDLKEPEFGHFERFETKLLKKNKHKNVYKLIAKMAVAASIILIFGIWLGKEFSSQGMQLAGVSAEMEETQSYFVSVIEKELNVVKKERNADTEQIITDGLNQLNKLETQYNALTLELKESNEDKRIIYAMISNFQQRIDVLQSLLLKIEEIKQLKNQYNENYI